MTASLPFLSLLVLSLGAFAIVALLVSGLVSAMLPLLDRVADTIAPHYRVRVWSVLSFLPTAVGSMAVLASFLPALGIGHDHCLVHSPHHPHLCPHHIGGGPGIVLVFLAAVVSLRAMYLVAEFVRTLRLSGKTSDSLAQASDPYQGAFVFGSEQPQAFVLRVLRPRVHVSRGLLSLGASIVEPVLAHERVHARRRDLLWRALCPLLCLGHLPSVAAGLRSRLTAAQELAADAEAAESAPGGRLALAEALVRLARLAPVVSPGISITHGNLERRVHALLDERRSYPRWPPRALFGVGVLVPTALALSHDLVHHALETALGALS